MTASFVNACVFNANSSGNGAFTVNSASDGWMTPDDAGAITGLTYRYRAAIANGAQWEIGTGTYTSSNTTLARTTILTNSSNTTAAINFTVAPQVTLTSFAEDLLPTNAFNLYQDSGRFAGDNIVDTSIGSSYIFPKYFTLYNGATAELQGKFITNNTDNGGTGGTMDSYVSDLIDEIRESDHRRYGVEFNVVKVTAGSGTSIIRTSGSVTAYYTFFTVQQIQMLQMTYHCYLQALTKDIVITCGPGQLAFKDGVVQTSNFLVSPSDGWVSIRILQDVQGQQSDGDQPVIFSTACQSAGDEFLVACPALIPGLINIDDDIGIIAGVGGWMAGNGLPLAVGGTGSSLSDPGADRIMFWDDSANNVTWLATSTGLSLSGTTLAVDGNVVRANTTLTISTGYTISPHSLGTISNFTANAALGNYQYGNNNGAFTLTAPTSDCAIDLLITNSTSAGSVTFSGFTTSNNVGGSLDTTNTHKFIISIRRINSISTYTIKALQ